MRSPTAPGRRALALLLTLATWAALPAPEAAASPWTLRQRQVAFVAGYDYQWATREFIEDRQARDFPLRGRYSASTLTLGSRFGLTDRLELEIILPVKLVSYTSDPVVLIPAPPGMEGIDHYQENVIDLSRTAAGIGDIWITGRYSLLRDPLPIALELRLKTPTGYDSPQGTFGDDPATISDFMAQLGTVVSPENVSDDVTLGDGQVDLNLNLLVGASFPSRTFMVAQGGYNLRFGGAGDQVLAQFKIGQAIGQRILAYAGVDFRYAVTQGRRIGVSVAAIDPSLPATEYLGTENLLLREVRLERDALQVAVGGIVRVTEQVELNIGYGRTVWGRNTAATNAVYISLGVRTQLIDPEESEPEAEPEPEPEPEPEDVEYEYEYVEEPVAEEPATPADPAEPADQARPRGAVPPAPPN